MEENNKIKLSHREGIGYIQKSAMGSHSYTVEETKTMSFLEKEILKKQIRGESLKLRNKNKTRYFLVEDGTVFKYNAETSLFYQLNLETMMWNRNQDLASLYYDTYLKFQELLNFEDYYDDDDEENHNNGRHF